MSRLDVYIIWTKKQIRYMLSKSEEMDCLRADELMRAVRENMDSDREKAKTAFGEIYQKYKSINLQ